RHRRLGADPRGVLRHRRAQADLRPAAGGRGLPALAGLRPRGHAHRHGVRRRRTAGRPGGSWRAGPGGQRPPDVHGRRAVRPAPRPLGDRSGAPGALAAAGWRLREISAPWLDKLAAWEDTLAVIVAAEAATVHRGRDWARYAAGTRALLGYGASVTDGQFQAAERQRAELSAAIEASLTGVDVLAGPTVGYQAPEEDPPFGAGTDSAESRFTGPYKLTGHPALSIPGPGA